MLRAYLHSVLVVAAGALASNCGVVGDDECGDYTNTIVLDAETTAQLYGSPGFTSVLRSGRRHFNWSFLVENICASEPAKVVWQLLVHTAQLPPGWQVSASYATTAATNTEVTLIRSDVIFGLLKYYATANVGMQQGSILGRAQLALDIEFAFTSQGDLSTDQQVAQLMQPGIFVAVDYKAAQQSGSAITAP